MRLWVTGAARRLDQFLVEAWPEPMGRRRLAALLAQAQVRVNGRPARKSTPVQAGDEVVVRLAASAPNVDAVGTRALHLVHCAPDLVALDKPPGMPSTEGPSGAVSVAALLARRFPEMIGLDGPLSAGLVHRLDTGTSGLLVAARNATMHATLRRAFHAHAIEKHYLAVVRGRLTRPRTIDLALQRRPHRRTRLLPARAGQRNAWPAITGVRPLRAHRDATLVHLTMRTGVTHQLRAHLAYIGHPVLGDERYGVAVTPESAALLAAAGSPRWHFLHAALMLLDVPETPSRLHTTTPDHWLPLLTHLGWTSALTDPAGLAHARP